jgi:hypothetical protein
MRYIRLARTAHAQRAGEREHHDYPAQHLEDAVDGLENQLDSHFGKHGEDGGTGTAHNYWNAVRLLTFKAHRLLRWYRDGLLCIGDGRAV